MPTTQEFHDGLRAWAEGHKPTMAAVDFLLMAEQRVPSQYIGEITGREQPMWWIDFEAMRSDFEAGNLGYLSGGEISAIALALALNGGVIDDYFWRMDQARKDAFVQAMARNA